MPIKWQNLIHGKCPKCDERMTWVEAILRCTTADCEGFAIGKGKLVSILTDPTHIVRRFMSPHEVEIVEGSIYKVIKEMV